MKIRFCHRFLIFFLVFLVSYCSGKKGGSNNQNGEGNEDIESSLNPDGTYIVAVTGFL